MVDPGIGFTAYLDEVRRQRAVLGNDAAQMAGDLAVARAENAQLRGALAALEARVAELTKEEPSDPE